MGKNAILQEMNTLLFYERGAAQQLRLFSVLLVSVLFLFFLPFSVQAEQEDSKSEVSAGVQPGSFFYWFDTLFERIGIWTAGGNEEKVERLLQYSEEKIAEIQSFKTENTGAASQAATRYETYLSEAIQKAADIQKDGQNVDALLQRISQQSLSHLQTFIGISQHVAYGDAPYIEQGIQTIEEQQKRLLSLIQDPTIQKETLEYLLSFLQQEIATLSPQVQTAVLPLIQSFSTQISSFVLNEGKELYNTLSESAKAYVREQANEQLNKVKDQIIQKIEGIEF